MRRHTSTITWRKKTEVEEKEYNKRKVRKKIERKEGIKKVETQTTENQVIRLLLAYDEYALYIAVKIVLLFYYIETLVVPVHEGSQFAVIVIE